MDKERLYRLQLAVMADVMPRACRCLLGEYGDAERICMLENDETDRLDYLTQEEKAELKAAKKRGLPLAMAETMEKLAINMICIDEQGYPAKIRRLEDAPYALFYRGMLPAEDKKHVAIIGARNCSDYGRRTAEYFGQGLAKAGVSVISGMARGIDGMAQEACVDAGQQSYALLGSGVDVIYPPSNKALYNKLVKCGGVISEYPPGRESLPFHFPMRNRLISAFSDLLLVVEAREKSGTFITVNYALEQGKDVYAVPGRIEDELSKGCNRLIAQGAGVAHCVEEVLLALTDNENSERRVIEFSEVTRKKVAAAAEEKPDDRWAAEPRHIIRKCLLDQPMTAQELYGRLGKPDMKIQELLTLLMQLEIEGLVLCRGGRYELK